MQRLFRNVSLGLVGGIALLAGCTSQATMDPVEAERYRTRLTLGEEPDGAQTVLEVRSAMLGEAPPDLHALLGHDHGEDAEEGSDHLHEAATEAESPAASVGAEGDEHADSVAAHDEEGSEQREEADSDHAAHDHAEHAHDDHDHAGDDHAAHDQGAEVVLVGVVGGVPNPSVQTFAEFPFATGRALFFLADPEAAAEIEEHGHHHAPGEECSFCAANAAEASALIAAVQFTDDGGKVLPIDVRELFQLKEKETVVVRGLAKVAPGGILTVNATGLYVRR